MELLNYFGVGKGKYKGTDNEPILENNEALTRA